MEIEQLAISRISTWLWQKCNPELPRTTENLDLIQRRRKSFGDLSSTTRNRKPDSRSRCRRWTLRQQSCPRAMRVAKNTEEHRCWGTRHGLNQWARSFEAEARACAETLWGLKWKSWDPRFLETICRRSSRNGTALRTNNIAIR